MWICASSDLYLQIVRGAEPENSCNDPSGEDFTERVAERIHSKNQTKQKEKSSQTGGRWGTRDISLKQM